MGVLKGIPGCLLTVVVVIVIGIIGIYAFFAMSPEEDIYEGTSHVVESVSPDEKWRVEVIEQTDGEPFEVYYGEQNQETGDMSMIYIPVLDDYTNPSADIEWKNNTVVDIIMLDEDQEQRRITLTVGEE